MTVNPNPDGQLRLAAEHLVKVYKKRRVVRDVSVEIRQGEIVGRVGSSGRVTAPHLHYEVHVAGTPVNPYRFLVRSVAATQTAKSDFSF